MLTPFQKAVLKILFVVLGYIKWQYLGKPDIGSKVADAEYCDELSEEVAKELL